MKFFPLHLSLDPGFTLVCKKSLVTLPFFVFCWENGKLVQWFIEICRRRWKHNIRGQKQFFHSFNKLENQDLLPLPLFFHTAWTFAFKLYSSGIVLQVYWRTFRVLVFGSLLFSVDMIPHWFINVEVQSMVETSTVCFTFQVLWQVIVILGNEAFAFHIILHGGSKSHVFTSISFDEDPQHNWLKWSKKSWQSLYCIL